MTASIQTVKHMKATYRKYQFITVIFAVITLAAAMIAASSGIRLTALQRKLHEQNVMNSASTASADEALRKQISLLQAELKKEKTASQGLKSKIDELNKKLKAIQKAIAEPKPADAPKAAPSTVPAPAQNAPDA